MSWGVLGGSWLVEREALSRVPVITTNVRGMVTPLRTALNQNLKP